MLSTVALILWSPSPACMHFYLATTVAPKGGVCSPGLLQTGRTCRLCQWSLTIICQVDGQVGRDLAPCANRRRKLSTGGRGIARTRRTHHWTCRKGSHYLQLCNSQWKPAAGALSWQLPRLLSSCNGAIERLKRCGGTVQWFQRPQQHGRLPSNPERLCGQSFWQTGRCRKGAHAAAASCHNSPRTTHVAAALLSVAHNVLAAAPALSVYAIKLTRCSPTVLKYHTCRSTLACLTTSYQST